MELQGGGLVYFLVEIGYPDICYSISQFYWFREQEEYRCSMQKE